MFLNLINTWRISAPGNGSTLSPFTITIWHKIKKKSYRSVKTDIVSVIRTMQGLPFPTARRPRASKTTSWASGFEQIFSSLFHISRPKNFKILEVGQVMILRKGKPCNVNQVHEMMWAFGSTISLAQCKTAESQMLRHWSYCSLALSHRYNFQRRLSGWYLQQFL